MSDLTIFFNNSEGVKIQNNLIVIGVNPIVKEITNNPQLLFDLLNTTSVKITMIYESETENFNQSLFHINGSKNRTLDFDRLETYRSRLLGGKKGRKNTAGLVEDILKFCENKEKKENMRKRIRLLQNNLRQFVNIIWADDVIWYCFTTIGLPELSMYRKITKDSDPELYKQLEVYVDFLLGQNSGGKYLSKPDDELIELYDMKDIPRGIYPRKAFYTTNFQRYSVWAFIFNRKGEVLLQQRSPYTAKRELVEELFLPEAEFSKYMSADLGDIVDFGEWNIEKRPEKSLRDEFDGLEPADWVVFRATDTDGEPLTVQRKSPRIMYVKDEQDGNPIPMVGENGEILKWSNGKTRYQEHTETWHTRFISDVFLFIAPDGYIDTQEQINDLMGAAEKAGAQSSHKLMTVEALIEDVEEHPEQYTDDMAYMCSEEKRVLVEFAESIKFIFNKME